MESAGKEGAINRKKASHDWLKKDQRESVLSAESGVRSFDKSGSKSR